ncbi:PAS domain S-box protein [Limisalsivibrio acetivorans]|uniref:PAS domain S-box protein n=1 Tax=Limisalsivibrio acetivorans TaxID=1304888 RepID=UPI00041AA498|nr:PAS domain S-box protein [Limisalsivibrio acetivorans]
MIKKDKLEIIPDALDLGVDGFIIEPCTPETFVRTVLKYAETVRGRREHINKNRALEESMNKLQAVTDNIGEGIYVLDEKSRLTFINPHAVKLLGYSPGELEGKRVHGILHSEEGSDNLAPADCRICGTVKTGEVFTAEIDTMRTKDGRLIDVEFTVTPVMEEGRPVGSVTVFRDITESLKTREADERMSNLSLSIARISSILLSDLDKSDVIRFAVKSLGEATQSDGVIFYSLAYGEDTISAVPEEYWRISEGETSITEVVISEREGWYERLLSGECIIESASRPGDIVNSFGIKSVLVVPIVMGGMLKNILVLYNRHIERDWSDKEVSSLISVAGNIEQGVVNREIEKRLKKSERKYREIINNTQEGFLLVNKFGQIIDANDSLSRITGYAKHEMLGKTPAMFYKDDELERFKERFGRRFVQKHRSYEFEVTTKSGKKKSIISHSTTLDDKAAEGGAFAFLTDITDQKQNERRIKYINSFLEGYKEALDQSAIVIKTDRSGIITHINNKLCTVTGCSESNIIGRHCSFLWNSNRREVFRKEIWDTLKAKDLWQGTIEHVRSDGEKVYLETTIVPITDDHGDVVEFIHICHDVSNLKSLVKSATIAEQAKTAFLANMSHEIRTPLHAIIGFLEMMENTSLSTEQEDYVKIVSKSAESLLSIINDILDITKIENNRLDTEVLPFETAAVFENACELFIFKGREKGVALRVFIDPKLPAKLAGDALRIKQVVSNLLSNAVKFTETGGEILLRVDMKESTKDYTIVEVSVEDSGIGIDETSREKIFEAFNQADSSITRRFGGTGLGLSISSSLVSIMGGELTMKSEPGVGSSFSFMLKLDNVSKDSLADLSGEPEVCINIPESRGPLLELVHDIVKRSGAEIRYFNSDELPFEEGFVMLCNTSEGFDYIERHAEGLKGRICLIVSDHEPEILFSFDDVHIEMLVSPIYPTRLCDVIRSYQDGVCSVSDIPEEPSEDKFSVKVLIAEDHEINQELIAIVMRGLGADVHIASNGKEACDIFKREDFDLIFMDVNMPVMDGLESTRCIIEEEKRTGREHTPIIALTANAVKGDRERFLEAGMDDYIAKPFTSSRLKKVIRKYVNPSGEGASEKDRLYDELESDLGIERSSLGRLVELFFEHAETGVSEIVKAAERSDHETIVRQAHRIKGAALNLKFRDIGRVARDIEAMGMACTSESYGIVITELNRELRRLRELLEKN